MTLYISQHTLAGAMLNRNKATANSKISGIRKHECGKT